MYPKPIQNLINHFSRLPSVGPHTANRYVFALLKMSEEELEVFAKAIRNIKQEIKICSQCGCISDMANQNPLCYICGDLRRQQNIICVVEKDADMAAIERLSQYNGTYHILGGNISIVNKSSINKLNIEGLIRRIKNLGILDKDAERGTTQTNTQNPSIKLRASNAEKIEIIIATNPTTEGDTTALYLERLLKSLNIKITRLGRGLPTGGEMEYADETTLLHALKERKENG